MDQPLDRRTPLLHTLLIGIACGLAVGLGARVARHVPPEGYWWASLGAPWFVAAFAAGALARDRAQGALAGGLAIVAGTAGYYAVSLLDWGPRGHHYVAVMVVAWSFAGAGAGALFGWAGAVWRRKRSSGGGLPAVALVSGALVGEALLLHRVWASPWAERVLGVELLAGLAIALVLSARHRIAGLVLTGVAACSFAAAEQVARETLRAVGWVGA
jgi:hypothetical protein